MRRQRFSLRVIVAVLIVGGAAGGVGRDDVTVALVHKTRHAYVGIPGDIQRRGWDPGPIGQDDVTGRNGRGAAVVPVGE